MRQKNHVFARFLEHIGGNIPIASVTDTHLESYISFVRDHAKTVGNDPNKTANRHVRDLCAMWRWALKRREWKGKITSNPCEYWEQLPEEEYVKCVPPAEDVDAVLLAAEPWQHDMLMLMLHTGARIGELRNLTWDDVNFDHREIVLWTRKRRGGSRESRIISMTPTVEASLRRLWRSRDARSQYVFTNPETGDGWKKNQHPMKNFMARICEKAGVQEFTFHALRHYVARFLRDSGKATPYHLQKLMGHKRLTTTEEYLKSLGSGLEDLVETINSIAESPTSESHTNRVVGLEKFKKKGATSQRNPLISGGEGGIRTLDRLLRPIPA